MPQKQPSQVVSKKREEPEPERIGVQGVRLKPVKRAAFHASWRMFQTPFQKRPRFSEAVV